MENRKVDERIGRPWYLCVTAKRPACPKKIKKPVLPAPKSLFKEEFLAVAREAILTGGR